MKVTEVKLESPQLVEVGGTIMLVDSEKDREWQALLEDGSADGPPWEHPRRGS